MMTDNTDYDFSALPDVVWVDVLIRLSLGERLRLALVCRRLNDAFNHPSVWRSVDVNLIGTLPPGQARDRTPPPWQAHARRPEPRTGVVAPDRYVAMIRRFGAYFQDVRLTVRGEVCELEDSCREVLEQLALCRLESLTLKVGEGTVQRKKPTPEAADALLALVKQARRLRSLDIRAWPLSDTDSSSCDIIACLRDNEKLRRLERLSLFCREPDEDSWVPLTTCLPTSEYVVGLVGHLVALTSLFIHSTLLTTKLVDVLCQPRRAALSRLGVMVVYRRRFAVGYDANFPEIQDSTWKRLRESNPALGVELTFCNTIPSYELMSLLSAELPLTSVVFMKYSNFKPDVLTCLAANYHRTLAKFADYGDTNSGKEDELNSMVSRCTCLCSLSYHSDIRPSTVLDLAAVRGNSWSRFEVNVRWTLDHGHGDDVLYLQPGTGNYAIAAHLPGSMFYHDAASDQQLEALYQSVCEQVSDFVGYKWQPLNKPSFN